MIEIETWLGPPEAANMNNEPHLVRAKQNEEYIVLLLAMHGIEQLANLQLHMIKDKEAGARN